MFQNFVSKWFFLANIRKEKSKHSNNKNKNIKTKILKQYVKNLIFKEKNMLIELEEDFIELKDKELKVSQIKIKNFK